MTNYNKAGLFIVFSKQANKFVIGYNPKYFNDVSFTPLILPITNEKILYMENLSLKIKLTNIFDCEN